MAIPTVNYYERESVELLKITLKKDNVPITSNVFLALVDSDERPDSGDWVPAIMTTDNKCGIIVSGLPVNTYTVWARVTATPEDAVFQVGTVKII